MKRKSTEYINLLEQNDSQDDLIKVSDIQEKNKLDLRRTKLSMKFSEQPLLTNEPQISTTDPDSRALLVHGQVEECYNVQTAVDENINWSLPLIP
ncbi:MAG: hypothetical protein IPM86_16475 [Saprospiraceae bacterium]|nr:hypothetical protein [Saprospiraceae bacterium]